MRRWRIAALLVLGLLLAAAALWLALPTLVRAVLVWQLEARTGRSVTLERFRLDVARGRLAIRGFRLADREPGPALVEVGSLEARFVPRALLGGHVWLERVELDAPVVRIVRSASGALNIADLLRREAGETAAISVDHLALTRGSVTFEDRTLTPPRPWRAEAITLEARNLSTARPGAHGTARLTAAVAGAPLSVDLFDARLEPFHARGHVALRDLDASLAQAYLPPDAPVVLRRAVLSLGLVATLDATEGFRLAGQGRVEGLDLRRRGTGVPIAAAPALAFSLASGGAGARAAGTRFTLTGDATVFDARTDPPKGLAVDRLRLVVDGAGRPGVPARVELTAGLPAGGDLRVRGTAQGPPLAAELSARIARMDLAFWTALVELPLGVAGAAEADLVVTLDAGAATPRLHGTLAIEPVTILDGERRLARARRIAVEGWSLRWPRLRVERIRLTRPAIAVRRDAEGRLRLMDILAAARNAPTPEPEARPVAVAPGDLAVEVDAIVVEDGTLRIRDGAVTPTSRLRIADLRAEARGVTWPARGPITLRLTAASPGAGSLSVDGTVSPAPLRFEGGARLAGVALAPYQPWVPLPARLTGRLDADLTVTGALEPGLALRAQGTAALSDLAFADGGDPLLTVGRLEARGLDYTWPATATVDRLRVDRSWARIERLGDGAFPLGALFTPTRPGAPGAGPTPPSDASPAPAADAPPISVVVRESVFENGAATIVDGIVSPTARFDIAGARLSARDFTWPARGPTPVELQAPTPGGGVVRARGELDLARRRLDLSVGLGAVALAPVQPYLPLRGRVSGTASGELTLALALDPLAIDARGALTLGDLVLADRDRPVVSLPGVHLTGIGYAWPASVTVDQIRASKARVLVERLADGTFPLAGLLGPARAAPPAAPDAGTPPPTLDIRRVTLEDSDVTIADGAVEPAARFDLRGASLTVQGLAWPASGPARLTLRTPMPGAGTLEARGQVALDAGTLDVAIALRGVDLEPARPYLLPRGGLTGVADADVRVRGPLAPPAVSVTGQASVTDPIVTDGQRTLASAKRLEIAGVRVDWPTRLAIDWIGLRQPWLLAEYHPEGVVPLLAVVGRDAHAPASAAPAARRSPSLAVGAVVVYDGFVRYVDATVRPRFVEEVSEIALTARDLGTAPATVSQVRLGGRLSGGAALTVEGTVGPVLGPLALDLEGSVSGYALPRLNPYLAALIGWTAERGALDIRLRPHVRDDRFAARTELVLGQPVFVPSRRHGEVRERVGLPLGILVALLKNSRGEIHLAFPVTGTLSTRRVDFGEAVWAGVRQTIAGALTLPASLIGSLFHTPDARLETLRLRPVSFEPGTARFRRGLERHADRLGRLLKEAPGVALVLKPVATLDDIVALKRDAIRRRIDAAAGASAQASGVVAARLYAERFPGGAVPAEPDAVVDALAQVEPITQAVIDALGARRVEATRAELQRIGGIDPVRLRAGTGPTPVEASGRGRVEFEIGE